MGEHVADEIRYLGDLQRLDLRSGDRLVLTVPGRVSQEMRQRFATQLREFIGRDVQVLILDGGMTLGAVGDSTR